MSDASTIYAEQRLAAKKTLWMAGDLGDIEMARVSTEHISEVARRLNVDENVIAAWLRRYHLEHTRTSYGIRVPLLTFPILKALSEGKPIDEARLVVGDIHERLDKRP